MGEREAHQEQLPFSIPSHRDLARSIMMQDMLKLDIENKVPNPYKLLRWEEGFGIAHLETDAIEWQNEGSGVRQTRG